jgi:hypothetical protein
MVDRRAAKILEGSFIAETFRAHSTNFFRQEKSFQDLLWPAHRYSGTGHTRITLVTLAPDSPARDLLRQPGEARRQPGEARPHADEARRHAGRTTFVDRLALNYWNMHD